MKKKLKVGTKVKVITGSAKGQEGAILKVGSELVVVEGVNFKTRHTKPRGGNEGGRVRFESGIHVSNIQVV